MTADKPKLTIKLEYPNFKNLSEEQQKEIREKLKSSMLLSFPAQNRKGEIRPQTKIHIPTN